MTSDTDSILTKKAICFPCLRSGLTAVQVAAGEEVVPLLSNPDGHGSDVQGVPEGWESPDETQEGVNVAALFGSFFLFSGHQAHMPS